ncbi:MULTISPECIES: hypothetical protein [unclassified Amycolatopsis]|uniref:hypothetical protein n=1 Tax=unclassified Amycolatopsis TaxID=2618356 RepID=UPI002E1D9649|nr:MULTISPECIES: hypothetical protein [unclassified Amycolatopsis]
MGQDIHGLTDGLEQFSPPPPDPGVAAARPGIAGGGLLETAELTAADTESATALTGYVQRAHDEFVALAGIARGAAQDYLAGNAAGAQALTVAGTGLGD